MIDAEKCSKQTSYDVNTSEYDVRICFYLSLNSMRTLSNRSALEVWSKWFRAHIKGRKLEYAHTSWRPLLLEGCNWRIEKSRWFCSYLFAFMIIIKGIYKTGYGLRSMNYSYFDIFINTLVNTSARVISNLRLALLAYFIILWIYFALEMKAKIRLFG